MSLIKYLQKPSLALISLLKRFAPIISDKTFIQLEYRLKMKQWPQLENPELMSEKIQWLKLNYRNAKLSDMVDKIEVKKFVAQTIGDEYIIPTLAQWTSAKDIDFDSLPEQYVLKCNHYGGGLVYICKDKSKFDTKKVRRKLDHQLKKDIYKSRKEWAYKDINRRILCEKYMSTSDGGQLNDYKFYCFNGKPQLCQVIRERFGEDGAKKEFYDLDWNIVCYGPYNVGDTPKQNTPAPKPDNFNLMLELAEKLAAGLPFVRVDLYNIDGKIYFGEMTFYPSSGMRTYYPNEWNKRLGDMLSLELD